jgi:transaldolase/glucose-6-phosphate isomerase
MATAAAGAALSINPFDQPDVQLAKSLAAEAMSRGQAEVGARSGESAGREAAVTTTDGLEDWLRRAGARGYVAVQAFLEPKEGLQSRLLEIRKLLQEATGLAVTTGIGPRYLHSTGQLHKGGPEGGLFLQVVDTPHAEVEVPETDFSFGRLIRAQADGDLQALEDRGREVLRLDLGRDAASGLEEICRVMRKLPRE